MSERFTKLFTAPENLYAATSPVIITAGALLKDNQTGKVLAQLKMRNIGAKTIKAATVLIHSFDTVGDPLGRELTYQYLDLAAAQGQDFGAKTPIPLVDAATRSFSVTVKEIIFADNTTYAATDEQWEPLPAPVTLEDSLSDAELVKQYRIQYGTDCQYMPTAQRDLWRCTCGEWSRRGTETCCHCGKSLSALMAVDWHSETERAEIVYQKACERMEKGQPDACLQALEMFRTIMDYRDSASKAAECAEVDRQSKKRKQKKTVGIVAALLLLTAIAVVSVSLAGSVMRSNMQEYLIGKTVRGDIGILNDTYEIHFLDESRCNILYIPNIELMEYIVGFDIPGISDEYEYQNVPYEITGGAFGLQFNWMYISDAFPDPSAVPFTIKKTDDGVVMQTEDFDDGIGGALYEK